MQQSETSRYILICDIEHINQNGQWFLRGSIIIGPEWKRKKFGLFVCPNWSIGELAVAFLFSFLSCRPFVARANHLYLIKLGTKLMWLGNFFFSRFADRLSRVPPLNLSSSLLVVFSSSSSVFSFHLLNPRLARESKRLRLAAKAVKARKASFFASPFYLHSPPSSAKCKTKKLIQLSIWNQFIRCHCSC